jgi:ammonium transporter, Amt family
MRKIGFGIGVLGALWGLLGLGAEAAQQAAPTVDSLLKELTDLKTDSKIAVDTIWVLVTAFLVFFMNLGFAMVESGFCRAKNTVNILAKNYIVFAISSLAFLLIGFGIMFGDGSDWLGTTGIWFLSGADNSPATGEAYQGVYGALNWTGVPLWAKFFFQMVFAATAATIVSGAVAERIKFGAFFLFSFVMVGILYPVTGHWIWGGGWLAKMGMLDFAGSTVVHSVGGWAALAGAIMLGPRLGKYRQGRPMAIPGHSMTSATLGVFILWFGWFGFNPGSTMAADWASIAHIATTTNTAAAAGAVSAILAAWVFLGKPDLSMALNGGLAGLVAITAPCAFVSVPSSVIIGLIAGMVVVASVLFFDRITVDDPVGAISVHMTCGVWGTLAVGLFGDPTVSPAASVVKQGLFLGGGAEQFQAQLIGVAAVGAFIFGTSLVAWGIIKGLVGLRVNAEEEMEGLDLGEHGMLAYPDFQIAAASRMPLGAAAAALSAAGRGLRQPRWPDADATAPDLLPHPARRGPRRAGPHGRRRRGGIPADDGASLSGRRPERGPAGAARDVAAALLRLPP